MGALFFGDGAPMFLPTLFIGAAGLTDVGGVGGACALVFVNAFFTFFWVLGSVAAA